MKKIVTTSILIFLTSLVYGQQKSKASTYFDYDSYKLTHQSKATLDSLLEKLKSTDFIEIEVSGHTDSDGDEIYNKRLSQNRSNAVQQYLISNGISNSKINIQAFGETQPVTSNDSISGKQKNRRVEIVIKFQDSIQNVKAIKEENKVVDNIKKLESNNYHQSFSVNRKNIQICKFLNTNEIVIYGEKGTKIRIPKNAFVDQFGNKVSGEITFELLEIYTKSDMVLNNIQTTSNQKLLESGGMIYIIANYQNSIVKLNKGMFYTIEFPAKDKKMDMNIFYGDTSSQNINWQQAKSNFRSDFTYVQNRDELNKYIFNSTEFGWINCDRFINQVETTNLYVDTKDTSEVNFCLVFKSINSVMNVSDRNEGIQFYNVPIGQKATLVAFKKKNQETYFFSRTINLQKNQSIEVALEKLTDKEFEDRIKQFD